MTAKERRRRSRSAAVRKGAAGGLGTGVVGVVGEAEDLLLIRELGAGARLIPGWAEVNTKVRVRLVSCLLPSIPLLLAAIQTQQYSLLSETCHVLLAGGPPSERDDPNHTSLNTASGSKIGLPFVLLSLSSSVEPGPLLSASHSSFLV